MSKRFCASLIVVLSLFCLVETHLLAENFSGTFQADTSDGKNILELKQSGAQITGTYTVGPTRLTINALALGKRAQGKAQLEGAPVKFRVVFFYTGGQLMGEITEEDGTGNPDPHTTEKIAFSRNGSAPATNSAAACEPAPSTSKAQVASSQRWGKNQATPQKQAQVQNQAAKNAPQYNTQLTEADLAASIQMLSFMWVCCGRDPSLITPQTVANVQMAIVQNFPTFPPQVQFVFANARQVYANIQTQWAQANQAQRLQMAQNFAVSLDQLGLTAPQAGGDYNQGNGGMSSQDHANWAADMVQGMAGSSYKSSW